jgi:8-oxo-dGTP pyrophosphatase MutT (NUDIX family)
MEDAFLRGDRNLVPSDAVVGLIVVDDQRYLMQLRSQKSGIFYPGHWGLFGGAVDAGEDPDQALQRELREELGVEISNARYFIEFSFDFTFCGHGQVWRRYYKISVTAQTTKNMVLGEGSKMREFAVRDLLSLPRLVPYDAFVVWLDATQR